MRLPFKNSDPASDIPPGPEARGNIPFSEEPARRDTPFQPAPEPAPSFSASDFAAADVVPEIDCNLSREAKNSVFQLVGNIREILVGDQFRSMDDRFSGLQAAFEKSLSEFDNDNAAKAEALMAGVRAEVETFAREIAGKADRIENANQETRNQLRAEADRVTSIESNLSQKFEALQAQNTKTGDDVNIASVRIGSVENNLSTSVTQLRAEDARVSSALTVAIDRIAALETDLTVKLERASQQQAQLNEIFQRSTARIADVEKEIDARIEAIQQREAALSDNIQVAIMRVGALEDRLQRETDDARRRESQLHGEFASGQERINALEADAETMRCAFNDKMREICEYVSGQVAELGNQVTRQREEFSRQAIASHNCFTAHPAPQATAPQQNQVAAPQNQVAAFPQYPANHQGNGNGNGGF